MQMGLVEIIPAIIHQVHIITCEVHAQGDIGVVS